MINNVPFTELLGKEAKRWISDYVENAQHGSQYSWTKERAEEFSRVSIHDLLYDEYFLNLKGILYPYWEEFFYELWEERQKRTINLLILIASIGSGKTYVASILQWLMWYELTCKYDHWKYYGLSRDSVTAFICFSRSHMQARKITFGEVYNRFQCPFNRDYFPPDPRIKRELVIPRNKVVIFPGTSSELSALGYNAYGATLDEASFMEVVEDSRKASMGSVYDTAEEMFNAVYQRMNSRFHDPVTGKVPGMICMISSPRYPDDFLERKIKEFQDGLTDNVFWKRATLWECKPKRFFPSGKIFLFDPEELHIVDQENEEIKEDINYLKIPIELKESFELDPDRAIRDLACLPRDALIPYFRNTRKIESSINYTRKNPFDEIKLRFNDDFICKDDYPRYIHLDLSNTRDATGIAMCHCPNFVTITRKNIATGKIKVEQVDAPHIVVDFIGRIKADRGEEIILGDIRDLIYQLSERGFYIRLITIDRFQGVDSAQILREQGFIVAPLSIDRTTSMIIVAPKTREKFIRRSTNGRYSAAMQALKDAMYEDRLDIPFHKWFLKECKSAEYNVRKDKVEKAARGSDDVLQAVAGAVFNCVNNESALPVNIENGLEIVKEPFDDVFYSDMEGRVANDPDDYFYHNL